MDVVFLQYVIWSSWLFWAFIDEGPSVTPSILSFSAIDSSPSSSCSLPSSSLSMARESLLAESEDLTLGLPPMIGTIIQENRHVILAALYDASLSLISLHSFHFLNFSLSFFSLSQVSYWNLTRRASLTTGGKPFLYCMFHIVCLEWEFPTTNIGTMLLPPAIS